MIRLLVSLARTVARSSKCFAALLMLALLTSPAFALLPGGGPKGNPPGGGGNHPGGGGQVPEFNTGAAGAAVALLAGLTLIAVDRSRRERRLASR